MHLTTYVEVYWTDHRLRGYPSGEALPQNIWRPQFTANKGLSLGEAEKYTQLPTFYKNVQDAKEQLGILYMKVHCNLGETGFNLAEDLDRMRAFPFDSTRVDFSIFFTGRPS